MLSADMLDQRCCCGQTCAEVSRCSCAPSAANGPWILIRSPFSEIAKGHSPYVCSTQTLHVFLASVLKPGCIGWCATDQLQEELASAAADKQVANAICSRCRANVLLQTGYSPLVIVNSSAGLGAAQGS